MVSDQDLANSVESLFRHSDPNAFTSFNGVVQHLEAKLGLDLSDKVGFIRDQIELLFGSSPQPPPPPPKQQQQHFDLQNHPQFQNTTHHSQIPSHFALQHQQRHHHHHHHHEELNFGRPEPHHPNLQQHQQLTSSQSRSHHRTQKNAAPDGTKPSTPAKRRGGPGGLNKACGVSPELQAIVGEPTMTRTEIVKQLWAYIRKHNLQDPSNKRKIICNDELRLVFETDCTDMFKMNKLLSKHIIRLEPSQEESSRDKKRAKVEVESVTESNEGGNSCSSPVGISEELAKFIDSESTEMPQSEALRRVWEYIQVHHLEDPMNPMVVICDGKLQELFGCEKISALGVTEMVGRHFSKQS